MEICDRFWIDFSVSIEIQSSTFENQSTEGCQRAVNAFETRTNKTLSIKTLSNKHEWNTNKHDHFLIRIKNKKL